MQLIRIFLFGFFLVVSPGVVSGAEDRVAALAGALNGRYAPHIDWRSGIDLGTIADRPVARYWRTAAEIRFRRAAGAPPLSGLHLALDPGHIGGRWAALEGREFRIAEGDAFVREGELALAVARRIRDELEAMGARVSLTRAAAEPVNPKLVSEYLERVEEREPLPRTSSHAVLADYAAGMPAEGLKPAIVDGDIVERARLINEAIRPDAVISIHINAARWPDKEEQTLVEGNHFHALVFGCVTATEFASERQREALLLKLTNGSGPEEAALAAALADAFRRVTGLPPSGYEGTNAVSLNGAGSYVWARNLLLLRMVECPTVLLEPYVANGKPFYARIQESLSRRSQGLAPAEDDVLEAYVKAVVDGVLERYGPPKQEADRVEPEAGPADN